LFGGMPHIGDEFGYDAHSLLSFGSWS
jgi:hypothetical protein